MLSKSYAAAKQFQSQISSVKNFQELKQLAKVLGVNVCAQIFSSSFWAACLDLENGGISGTIEVRFQPQIRIGMDVFEARSQSVRMEMPRQMRWDNFEMKFFNLVKESILFFRFIDEDIDRK